MEEHRPHQAPAYQTVYQVAVLTAITIGSQACSFNYFEFMYRGAEDSYKYPVLGLFYGILSFFGAVYGNVQAKRLKSCSNTAAQCCALTIPLQLYMAWQVRQDPLTVTYNWHIVVITVGLSAFGNGGLLTNTFGFVSKQCTQLTSGQQFGYIGMGLASVQMFLMITEYHWEEKFTTLFSVVATGVATFMWHSIDENQTDNMWDEENIGTIWENFWEHMPLALVGQTLGWVIEEQTEDLGYDDGITQACWWVICAAAVGGSIFAFGMDSKPNTLVSIWCGILALGYVGFFLELQSKDDGSADQRYLICTMVLQQLAMTGSFLLVLTKVAYNKNNVLNNISQWLAQWFLAWIFVFCVLELGDDSLNTEQGTTLHLGVYGIACLLAISTKFNVKWDAHKQKDMDVVFGTVDQNDNEQVDNRQVGMEDF